MALGIRSINTVLITLVICICSATVHASGSEGPYDLFVSRSQPDFDLDVYESGNLGIILPTYPRVFLYPAWRAILLGKLESPQSVVKSGVLKNACCSMVTGWVDVNNPESPQSKWLSSRATINPVAPRVGIAIEKLVSADSYIAYRNCSDSAFLNAQSTLENLKGRKDVSSKRLKEWVSAQDAVFEFCGYVEGRKSFYNRPPPPEPELPLPLAKSEPKFWQQMREYQIASASFYSGDNDQASILFQAIGNTPGHPMYKWGKYLSLRAQIRKITLNADVSFNSRSDQVEIISDAEAYARMILKDPKLADVHEATKASIRALEFKLTPEKRLEQLSKQLNDWHASPHTNDALGDWRRLANDFLDNDYLDKNKENIEAMRNKYNYFDWMRTIQRCNGTLPVRNDVTCEVEAKHALDRWQKANKAKSPEAKAWFVAVVMTAQKLEPEIKAAAEKIPESAPEFHTVQYFISKLVRESGNQSEASTLVDAELAKPFYSQSAKNLFLQERFSLAKDLQDASQYLTRSTAVGYNSDTKEVKDVSLPGNMIAEDVGYWLNSTLAVNDLIKLSQMENIHIGLRQKIAIAAWARADLLGTYDLASRAASNVATLAPQLNAYTEPYLQSDDAIMRRHIILMGGIRNKISPIVEWRADQGEYEVLPKDATASMWCKFKSTPPEYNGYFAGKFPPTPQLSEDTQGQEKELARLEKIGSSTGEFTKHLFKYAEKYPTDSELPWLLYVAVHSTRGGCVDADNAKTSRKAWSLLHSRFGKSEWAKKTPYWYGSE